MKLLKISGLKNTSALSDRITKALRYSRLSELPGHMHESHGAVEQISGHGAPLILEHDSC
jgi:hypothetical protein